METNNTQELQKRLENRIEFGTAGLRAKMQAGFNGINELTILQASQGLATYAAKTIPNALSKGVVIGYDHRHQSKRFAALTALAFSQVGFETYLFSELVHTPLVPFGINCLGAACGVMITASHNPAQDNGYKVYWENGCQIIPPLDSNIAKEIERNLLPWTWDTSLILADPKMTSEICEKYFEAINTQLIGKTVCSPEAKRDIKIVYTPMHGVGHPGFMRIAKTLGLQNSIIVVEEQKYPDPDFSTVKFPNPEEKGSLDLAKKYGDENGSSVIFANDPDADRFAVAIKDLKTNQWVQLTGNQLGALFTEYVLEHYEKEQNTIRPSELPDPIKPLALINSTVSSKLMEKMAKNYGCHYEETLTGFKWIGNRAIELTTQGYNVPFAFEEAIGYMFSVVFDKDGISAATVFLKMIFKWHQEGTTPLEQLERIYLKYGYFSEYNSYYTAQDPSIITEVFNKIRYYENVDSSKRTDSRSEFKSPPKVIGPFNVLSWRDLTIGYDSTTSDYYPTLPVSSSTEMITVELETDSSQNETIRFTARGSGTEPKLKVYIEVSSKSKERAQLLTLKVWETLAVEWFSGLASV